MSRNLYLSLGDSITAGYGVGRKNSFAALYYHFLQAHFPDLRYLNLGINGLTTAKLAFLLNQRYLRALVKEASIITLTIGSADLLTLGRAVLARQQVNTASFFAGIEINLEAIGWQIRTLNPVAPVKIANIYNPLPAGPFTPYLLPAQNAIDRLNGCLLHGSNQFSFIVVPVNQCLNGLERLVIGPDHLHLNLLGQQIIAEQFAYA